MEETYEKLRSKDKKEILEEFRKLVWHDSNGVYNFLKYLSQKDDNDIYELFKNLIDNLYYDDLRSLEKSVYHLFDYRMEILFLGGLNVFDLNVFNEKHIVVISENIKNENQSKVIDLMANYLNVQQFEKVLKIVESHDVVISNRTLIAIVSALNTPNAKAVLLMLYAKEETPNEEIYNKISDLLKEVPRHEINWEILLNSPNAPYLTLFSALQENYLSEFYSEWLAKNSYQAFLYEEYLYENGFIDEHEGLLSYILAGGTLENFYRIMNVWRLNAKDKKEELRVYYKANIHEALLDYSGVGFDIDQKYFEIMNRKRQEKLSIKEEPKR